MLLNLFLQNNAQGIPCINSCTTVKMRVPIINMGILILFKSSRVANFKNISKHMAEIQRDIIIPMVFANAIDIVFGTSTYPPSNNFCLSNSFNDSTSFNKFYLYITVFNPNFVAISLPCISLTHTPVLNNTLFSLKNTTCTASGSSGVA